MTTAWIVVGLALALAGVLAVHLRRARARLRAAEQRMVSLQRQWGTELDTAHRLRDLILETADNPLLIADTNHTVLLANPAAEQLLGRDLAGKSIISVLRQPDLETLLQDAHRFAGESLERHIELDQRILLARATVPATGVPAVAILSLRDVTELQRLERARREMVANITHELGTPITAIGLLADTLLNVAEREKPKRLRKMARDIRRETDTLTHLVQEMRDLSLIESGQMPIRLTPTDLAATVRASVEQLRSLAESKEQSIVIGVPDETYILADSQQIERAIKNIVHNAIKFAPVGGQIQITGTIDASEAILAVRDNGPGIAAADLPRIFERFYQVDRARHEGTGLGLAIVRHIMLAHGGRVWAESVEGQGATFYLALALASSTPGEASTAPQE